VSFAFRASITTKMALLVLLGTLAVLAFILVYSEIVSRKIILTDAETSALTQALAVAGRMDEELRSVAKVAENLAIAVECGTWSEQDLLELIARVVKGNKELFGSAIAFEPHAFRSELKAFAPYYYKEGNSLKFVQLGSDSYDYFIKDWYRIPRDLKAPVWSAPYYDEGGGEALMTSFGCPFFQRDDFGASARVKGIITADLSLEGLTKMVSAVKVEETGFAFLISEYGTFLAYPNRAWIMRESIFSIAEEQGAPILADVGRKMIRSEAGFVDVASALTGKDSFLVFARLPSTGWSLGVVFPKNELFAEIGELHKTIAFLAIVGISLLLVVSYLVARSITGPIRRVAQATTKVAEGDLDIQLVDASRRDEVGQLASAFMGMAKNLKRYIDDLTKATAAKERIESELSIAASIQKSMLPSTFPPFPGREEFDIHAVMRPAKEVGGDFYDFLLLDERRLCVVVGDVSGKGVPAALFMTVTKYLVEAAAGENAEPENILRRVNGQLSQNNDACMFVTLFLGILDLESGELSYANAGHNPPLLVGRDGEASYLERPGGPILGVMDDATFRTDRRQMNPGDTLIVYSDGVTEAADDAGLFFGEDRLLETMSSIGSVSARQITGTLLNEIDSFSKNAPQADDITILALRFTPSA
jgi:sigma-B regulation protein RsbU (phosphoserine phosphatase)